MVQTIKVLRSVEATLRSSQGVNLLIGFEQGSEVNVVGSANCDEKAVAQTQGTSCHTDLLDKRLLYVFKATVKVFVLTPC